MAPLPANSSLDESGEPFPLPSPSAAALAIFSTTFLLGCPGNGLVIWVTALKMKRTVNTVWFLHLAIADLVCCLSLPFSIAQLALHYRWPFGWLFCKVLPSVIVFNMFASVLLLTTISIDRCLLVMKPVWCQNHRTVRLASVVCGVIWILAFLLCGPSLFYRETLEDEFGNARCISNWKTGRHDDYEWLDDLWDVEGPILLATESAYNDVFPGGNLGPHPSYPTERNTAGPLGLLHHYRTEMEADVSKRAVPVAPSLLYEIPRAHPTLPTVSTSLFKDQPPSAFVATTVTRAVFGFLLPFVVMATCYALIAWKVLAKPFVGPRRRALRVVLLVVATFFLCWAPYHITGVLFLLAAPQTLLHQALLWWDSVFVALAYANSCLNPLLYVFVGQNFRRKACQTVQAVFEGALGEPSSPGCSQDKRQATMVDNGVDASTSL
ncbi:C3a anaphylatoxin chemotactic receptor [Notechis scutatus]|uniref:C3a anaphylatoxin chemotactic receptor n=1 Tax=Notechis scutatus TaxID=8663 RepID=A0A6J1VQZ0_9SAUR|nr:C3a anaphylatoxin chemotactic receptor [Notechis scutatus]